MFYIYGFGLYCYFLYMHLVSHRLKAARKPGHLHSFKLFELVEINHGGLHAEEILVD